MIVIFYKYNYQRCIIYYTYTHTHFCNIIALHTWTVPYQDSACTDFPASGPTTGSRLRNRCSNRRPRLVLPRYHPGRTAICISAPAAPSTSSSSRDSAIGIPAYRRICRPVYRPPRHRKGPSGSPKVRRAPLRSEQFPRTTHRDPLSMAVHRNMYTI